MTDNPTAGEPADVDNLNIRPAVRSVLLTPDESVLLVRFEFSTATVWALPGGGVDPGETDHEALRRELSEEVGDVDVEIGPHIWTRLNLVSFVDAAWDGQRDTCFLVPIAERFEPEPGIGWEAMRAEKCHELRWWTVDEVVAADDVLFAPRRLGPLLRELVDNGIPDSPIDTGV